MADELTRALLDQLIQKYGQPSAPQPDRAELGFGVFRCALFQPLRLGPWRCCICTDSRFHRTVMRALQIVNLRFR